MAQTAAGEVATGPVAIRTYQLLTPRALAGSGLRPEVEVRIEIDRAGAVAQVDVLAIDPPSQFDDLLRAHVERSIKVWRYGPARDRVGNAVPATLSWRMKFESPEPGRRSGAERRHVDPQLDVLVSAGVLPRPRARPSPAQKKKKQEGEGKK